MQIPSGSAAVMDDEGLKKPLFRKEMVRRGQRMTPKSEDLLIRAHEDLRLGAWAFLAPTREVRARCMAAMAGLGPRRNSLRLGTRTPVRKIDHADNRKDQNP